MGPSSSHTPFPTRPMDPGKRESIASGPYSDTSGTIRSGDNFWSIGCSYGDYEQVRIVVPPMPQTRSIVAEPTWSPTLLSSMLVANERQALLSFSFVQKLPF